MFVCPCIEAAGDDLLGMIFEIVKDGNVRVTGDLRSLLANLLIGPQIFSEKFIVRAIILWTR